MNIATLTIEMAANIARLTQDMQAARSVVERNAKAMQQAAEAVGNAIGLIAAGFSLTKFISETAAAQDQQTQLTAVLRSTGEAAGWSAGKLNDMAATLAEKSKFSAGAIGEAQTRLLSYTGVAGKEFPRAMQNVIDMAQRMGTDVKSAAETVGRALDIPSQGLSALSKQGFRFTEEQKKLVEKLEETGKVGEAQAIIFEAMEASYAGAAEAARHTLGGALVQLQDNINDLMTGGDGSVNGLSAMVEMLAASVRDADDIIKAMGNDAATASGQMSALQVVQESLATIFETVAALGANVMYVLQGVGREIGGLAAQAAAAATLDFDSVAAIRQEMINDGEAARKEIDATTARILGAREAAKKAREEAARNAQTPDVDDATIKAARTAAAIASQKAADNARALKAAHDASSAAAKKAAAETLKLIEEGAKLTASLLATEGGLSGDFAEKWEKLNVARRDGRTTLEELTKAQAVLLSQQPAMKKADDEAKKALEEEAQAWADVRSAMLEYRRAQEQKAQDLSDGNKGLREEIELIGLSSKQQTRVLQQRNEAIILTKRATLAEMERANNAKQHMSREQIAMAKEIEGLEERNELLGAKEARESWSGFWESVDQTAHDTFVNVADEGMDAFKRIGKTLKSAVLDMLYQMTIKKWIFSIAGSMGGGAGGLMNSARNAYSLYGAASGYSGGVNTMAGLMGAGSAAGASAVSLGYANAVGAVGGDALGALIAGNASWAGVAAGSAATAAQAAVAAGLAAEAGTAVALAAGTQAAAAGTVVAGGTAATGGLSAITGAMAAIPVWGWALAAAAGLGAMLSKKQTLHSGAGAVYSAEGGLQEGAGIYNQSTFGMGDVREYNKAEQSMASGIATGLGATLDGLAVAFGQTAGYEIATAFADDSSKDGAWGSLRISKDGKDMMNWEDTRKSKWAPKEFSDGEAGQKEYLAAIAKDTHQVLLDMDLPSWADTLLTSIGEVASMEQLSQAVMQIGQIQTAFVQLGKTVDGFAGMGDKAFEALLQASGGIEALTTNVGAYYEAYYTEAERMGKATEQLTAELAKAGVAMPASKDAYRALVTQQLEAGEGGAALAAQLLGLSGAFVQVADYAAAVAEEWAAVQLKFLSPAERDQAQYDSIAASLRGSGMGLSIADFAGQLKNATLASIGAIAQEVWPTLQTDEARLALIRATSALADLKGGADALGKGQFEAVDSAFAALQKSVGLQRSVVQEAISSMRAVFDALRDNARELYGEVESASLQSADAGRAFIDNALANAQATGYMPDADDLRDAIDGVRKGIAQQQYASTFESDRDRLVLAGKLTDLKDIAGPQLTEAQRQLAALEEMLETARTQIDELRGINTSMLSVSAAMTLLAAAISAEKVMQPQLAAPKPPAVLASGGPSNSGYSQSEMAGAINITLGQGASVADIINAAAVNYGITEREVREAAKFAGIPGFASGGLHSGGLRVVGERGWEVEATGPSRIWNQQQLGAALCGGGNTARLEALVEGLTAEVQRLQGIVARGVEHQRETAEILDNVTEGGNAMRQGAMV